MSINRTAQAASILTGILLAAAAIAGPASGWGRDLPRHGRLALQHRFTPRDIPNCGLWLDAGRGALLDGGGLVSTWKDRSARGNDAVQTTQAARPLWTAEGVDGCPEVRFDGVDDLLEAHGAAALLSGEDKPFTLTVVVSLDSGAPVHTGFLGATGNETNFDRWRAFRRVSGFVRYTARDAAGYKEVTCDETDYDTTGAVLTFSCTGTTMTVYKNGAPIGSGAVDQGDIPLNYFWLGKVYQAAQSWMGTVAELLLYDRELTAAERGRLETYLKRKQGIAQ